jgi:hypothetical protein
LHQHVVFKGNRLAVASLGSPFVLRLCDHVPISAGGFLPLRLIRGRAGRGSWNDTRQLPCSIRAWRRRNEIRN